VLHGPGGFLRQSNATIMLGDRKHDWPFTPSLLQVYVDDVQRTLDEARRLGATACAGD
jgi:PhnB protein